MTYKNKGKSFKTIRNYMICIDVITKIKGDFLSCVILSWWNGGQILKVSLWWPFFFCALKFYMFLMDLHYFVVEGKIMLPYTCMHTQALPLGCLSPAVGGKLQGSLCHWVRSCSSRQLNLLLPSGKLVEGLEEMRWGGGQEEPEFPVSLVTSTGMSIKPNLLFQNIFVCRIQNTESHRKEESPEGLCWFQVLSQSMVYILVKIA